MKSLIKILEGRQSIPEITHIYDYDNPTYLADGNVDLKVTGYSFNNRPTREPRANNEYRVNRGFNEYRVYISCTDSQTMFNIASETVDIFQNLTVGGDKSLAILFPAFSGFQTTFEVTNENIMHVHIPPVLVRGCFEIILLNRAGYTRSSQALGSYACTDEILTGDGPCGLLKQSGENLLRQTSTYILRNTGDDEKEKITPYAGSIACDP